MLVVPVVRTLVNQVDPTSDGQGSLTSASQVGLTWANRVAPILANLAVQMLVNQDGLTSVDREPRGEITRRTIPVASKIAISGKTGARNIATTFAIIGRTTVDTSTTGSTAPGGITV